MDKFLIIKDNINLGEITPSTVTLVVARVVARLAQSVEHETLNLGVVGLSPALIRNAMECLSELVEALGNNALPYRTVAQWIGTFQQGRVSTIHEQRSGRPVNVLTNLASVIIEQRMDYI
ncbi:uncharacterized protein TNCV_1284951 [Trichonephila clavipes]|uniref:Uncharacterized protein n=1 Tax=Trichonephila clavipes TaxID=2585209 RepID=A0A8X6SQI7_TRICX|nr:uncharacterized protein TNCV_1284951 [Trichonephila clavipes]